MIYYCTINCLTWGVLLFGLIIIEIVLFKDFWEAKNGAGK